MHKIFVSKTFEYPRPFTSNISNTIFRSAISSDVRARVMCSGRPAFPGKEKKLLARAVRSCFRSVEKSWPYFLSISSCTCFSSLSRASICLCNIHTRSSFMMSAIALLMSRIGVKHVSLGNPLLF